MNKKKIMLSCIVAAIIATLVVEKGMKLHTSEDNEMFMMNIEALSQSEDADRDILAALRPEECTLNKTNFVSGFFWNGKLIAVGGTYEVKGTQMACKFNLFNTCDVTKQTTCTEN